jgi:hypothetical protein
MLRPLYFKFKESNNATGLFLRNRDIVNTLIVGTAENRVPEPIDEPDLPDLINADGTIYDHMAQISDFDRSKEFILGNINSAYKNSIIKYSTVCPSYSNNKRNEYDDSNYINHFQCLLSELDDNMYDNISIVGCFNDFFDDINVDKIIQLMHSDGYLIIHDTVPYNLSDYFKTKFQLFYL